MKLPKVSRKKWKERRCDCDSGSAVTQEEMKNEVEWARKEKVKTTSDLPRVEQKVQEKTSNDGTAKPVDKKIDDSKEVKCAKHELEAAADLPSMSMKVQPVFNRPYGDPKIDFEADIAKDCDTDILPLNFSTPAKKVPAKEMKEVLTEKKVDSKGLYTRINIENKHEQT